MFCGYTNGGWNKCRGTIEKVPRIDSHEVKEMGGCDTMFGYADGKIVLVLDCCHIMEYTPDRDIESVEVRHPKDGWCETLELSRKENGYGGYQTFFLCPVCGKRYRYLYQTGETFLCRNCAKLNYRSQQETRSDCMFYYHKGMRLIENCLSMWPQFRPDGFSFFEYLPDRPRYMHKSTYSRYLVRFLRYREKHEERQIEGLRRLMKHLN